MKKQEQEPVDTIAIIQSHLDDLFHTQHTLQEQSVGIANQIFILEHILKDMGIPPSPSTSTGVPIAAKTQTSEGPPPANTNVPEAPTGDGTQVGGFIL